MFTKHGLIDSLKFVALIAVFILGMGYALAAWTGPASAPPTCSDTVGDPNYREGCSPPLNVSNLRQYKGKLGGTTGTLGTYGLFHAANGIFISPNPETASPPNPTNDYNPAYKLDVDGDAQFRKNLYLPDTSSPGKATP